jgi:hypothetical protein
MSRSRLVQGIAVNDADYVVEGQTGGIRWVCPYYKTWKSMVTRCYSEKYHAIRPSYSGVKVCDEWLTFSNFKAWMELQDWEGNALDKDLLSQGSKVYSPDTCVFVSPRVNSFITEKRSSGLLPTGVIYREDRKTFVAKLRSNEHGYEYLGSFPTPEEAHQAWRSRKRELATELSLVQTDPRIADALLKINYGGQKR